MGEPPEPIARYTGHMDGETTKPAKKARGLRRRHVLVGAGAAVGGLAITKALGLYDVRSTPGQTQSPTAAGIDWISPPDKPEAQVTHLLRRATFGATPAEYEQSIKDGFKKTVDRLVETKASQDKPIKPQELVGWWLDWMLRTPTPFAERMTFFWHGHFTSDFRKVNLQTPFIYWQNLTWRQMSLGNLHDVLYQVTIDPGMLRYLDLGTSTGKNPNENYSRELMELFSMGVGTFTEDDVRNGAKALSGWREPLTKAMYDALVARAQQQGRPGPRNVTPDAVKTGVFEQQRAYAGAVKFLGETRQWDTKSRRVRHRPAGRRVRQASRRQLPQIAVRREVAHARRVHEPGVPRAGELPRPGEVAHRAHGADGEGARDAGAREGDRARGSGHGSAPLRSAGGRRVAVERQLDLEQQRARACELCAGDAHRDGEDPAVQGRARDPSRRCREPGDGRASQLEPRRRDALDDPPRVAGISAEVKI